jgi:hypothetical protein
MSKRGRCALGSEKQQLYGIRRAPDAKKLYIPPPVASNGMPNGVGSRSAPACLDGLPIEVKLLNKKSKKGSVTTHFQPRPMWIASERGRKVYLTSRGALDAWIRDYRMREDKRGIWERQHPAYPITPVLPSPPPSLAGSCDDELPPLVNDASSTKTATSAVAATVSTAPPRVGTSTAAAVTPQRGVDVPETVALPPTQGPNIVCRPDMFDDLSPTKPCQCGSGMSAVTIVIDMHGIRA